jgi:hypothetical protein
MYLQNQCEKFFRSLVGWNLLEGNMKVLAQYLAKQKNNDFKLELDMHKQSLCLCLLLVTCWTLGCGVYQEKLWTQKNESIETSSSFLNWYSRKVSRILNILIVASHLAIFLSISVWPTLWKLGRIKYCSNTWLNNFQDCFTISRSSWILTPILYCSFSLLCWYF